MLIALKQAQELGIEVPEKVTKPAIASIIRQRYPDFAYAYGEYLKYVPRMDINRPGGSLGRSQVCNLGLAVVWRPAGHGRGAGEVAQPAVCP